MAYKVTEEIVAWQKKLMTHTVDGGVWFNDGGMILCHNSRKEYRVAHNGPDADMLKAVRETYRRMNWEEV